MARAGRKKVNEQYLIDWRRKQVAEYDNMGWEVKRIASTLHVDSRTIYRDLEYIDDALRFRLGEYVWQERITSPF